MDQTIGIQYQATGADRVIQETQRIESALTRLQNRMASFANKAMGEAVGAGSWLGKLTSQAGAIGGPVNMAGASRIADNLKSVASNAERGESAIRSLTGALRAYARELRSLPPFPARSLPPRGGGPAGPGGPLPPASGAAGSGARGGRAASQMGLSPYGFMGRWWGAYMGAHAAGRFAKDTALGGARADLMPGLRDLGMVGFDRAQRMQTENTGFKFLRGMYSGGDIKQYMGAVAEAASAFDVNSQMFAGKGVEALNKLAQTSMYLGASSQMGAVGASKLLMNTIHAQMAQMPLAQREKYQSGQLSVADLGEKTGGKIAKIIQSASIWGTDVANSMAYALPSALAKGWDMDTLLALVGAARTAGHKAPKIGRGLKSMIEGETGKVAGLAIAGAEDPTMWQQYNALPSAQRKQYKAELTNTMDQLLRQDPVKYFERVGKWIKVAESRGINLVQQLGFSKEWIGLTRLFGEESFLQQVRQQKAGLAKANSMAEVKGFVGDIQQDPGWISTRAGNTWKEITSGMASNTPLGGMVESWLELGSMIADWNRGASKFNWGTALGELKDFGVHGLIGGLAQTTADIASSLAQRFGILDQGEQFTGFEERLSQIEAFPGKVQGYLQSMVDRVGNWFTELDATIASKIEAAKGAISAVDPRNWNLKGAADSALDLWMDRLGLSPKQAPTANDTMQTPPRISGEPAPEGYISSPIIVPQVAPLAQLPGGGNVMLQSLDMGGGPPQGGGEQTLIHNVFVVDGSVLYESVNEIISANRDRSYQTFGSDPNGFNVGV